MLTISEVERLSSAPSIKVTPVSAVVNAGSSQQFCGTLYGSDTVDIRWTVAGSGSVGEYTGLYTAPSALSEDTSASLTAYLATSPDVSGSVAISVVAPIQPVLEAKTVSLWTTVGTPSTSTYFEESTPISNPTALYCRVGGPLPDSSITSPRYLQSEYISFTCTSTSNGIVTSYPATGYIEVNGASGISSTITSTGEKVVYTLYYTDVASGHLGWPSVNPPGTDTVRIDTDTGYGIISKHVDITPIRPEILRSFPTGKTSGVDLISPSGSYTLKFYTQDTPSGSVPSVTFTSDTGSYSSDTLTGGVYTPSGVIEQVTASMPGDSGKVTVSIYYDLKVDSVSPDHGYAGTTVTITGGYFNPSMFIMLNDNTKVLDYTLSADKKSLTFTMPTLKIGGSVDRGNTQASDYAGPVYIKLYYHRIETGSDAGNYLVKAIDTPFILYKPL